MHRVTLAQPYRTYAMSSTGDASGMLIRQHKFPYTYREDEMIWSADHDRVVSWDYDHWVKVVTEYKERMGGRGFESWLQYGKAEDILPFLVEVMKADNGTEWTGFRILGTVNRSNGYPVYSLQLFAKNPKGKTKVYSSGRAPNVYKPEPRKVDGLNGFVYFLHHSFEDDLNYEDAIADFKKLNKKQTYPKRPK